MAVEEIGVTLTLEGAPEAIAALAELRAELNDLREELVELQSAVAGLSAAVAREAHRAASFTYLLA